MANDPRWNIYSDSITEDIVGWIDETFETEEGAECVVEIIDTIHEMDQFPERHKRKYKRYATDKRKCELECADSSDIYSQLKNPKARAFIKRVCQEYPSVEYHDVEYVMFSSLRELTPSEDLEQMEEDDPSVY